MKQTTDTVLMVRPAAFTYNAETAGNNCFQQEGCAEDAQARALSEFDRYAGALREAGIRVIVAEDTPLPATPDSIFPNNWFSTHAPEELQREKGAPGLQVLYPMYAPNRREERNKRVLETLEKTLAAEAGRTGSEPKRYDTCDLTSFENRNRFLEGTGSMILDRENRLAFCCTSPRTDESVLERFAEETGYDYFLFEAEDRNGRPIYHTNVMMCIGTRYAAVCLDAVRNLDQRERLIELLEEAGKEIFEITPEQMERFAGNMLELRNTCGEAVWVLSASAWNSLDPEQQILLKNHYKLVVPKLDCIECNGGGSARCMLAEIF